MALIATSNGWWWQISSCLQELLGDGLITLSPLFFFFFEVEMSLHTPIPLFRPGLVHSGSASWDDSGWAFPTTSNQRINKNHRYIFDFACACESVMQSIFYWLWRFSLKQMFIVQFSMLYRRIIEATPLIPPPPFRSAYTYGQLKLCNPILHFCCRCWDFSPFKT